MLKRENMVFSYNEDHINQNMYINTPFYVILLSCLLVYSYIKQTSFVISTISLIVVSIIGYFIHVFSHSFSMTEMLSKQDNYFTRNTNIKPMLDGLCKFMDFHNDVHHDQEVNKHTRNIIYEAINNFLTQGGILFILSWLFKHCDPAMFLLWAFIYTTVHNVNYLFHQPIVHQQHHTNKHSNLGIDLWDIIFNSKYADDMAVVEDYNHMSINVIIGIFILCIS